MHPPQFKGAIATSTTVYVGVPIHGSGGERALGAMIGWTDATSAATITLELSSFGPEDAPIDEAGSAWEWDDSDETITGPAGAAAGVDSVYLQNVQAKRARLKIVTSANSDFEIHDGAA
jgi:hypothetical protein